METKAALRVLAAVVCLAWPGAARADCPDLYQCICVDGVVVMGTSKGIALDGGASTKSALVIERVGGPRSPPPNFVVGSEIPMSGSVGAGVRVLAVAQSNTATEVALVRQLEGASVACSGATFSEQEAIDVAFADDCRKAVGDRIEPDCNDTAFLCTARPAGSSREERGRAALLLLPAVALLIWLHRRRRAA